MLPPDLPGIREIVEHGVNGILVHARDANSLAQGIDLLLNSEDLRFRYGLAGRIRVEERFRDREVVDRYLAEYSRLWKSRLEHGSTE